MQSGNAMKLLAIFLMLFLTKMAFADDLITPPEEQNDSESTSVAIQDDPKASQAIENTKELDDQAYANDQGEPDGVDMEDEDSD